MGAGFDDERTIVMPPIAGDPYGKPQQMTEEQIAELRSWWQRLRSGKRVPETGKRNAERFVATVLRAAREGRLIVCRMDAGFRERKSELCGWQWMPNDAWRAYVLAMLKISNDVCDCKFSPPDALDGWTFRADSTVPVPRVASLTLDQSL